MTKKISNKPAKERGPGRPRTGVTPKVRIQLYVTEAEREAFLTLGGSAAIVEILREKAGLTIS